MKLSTFAVAGAVLAASFSSALADGLWKNGDVLPIEQVSAQTVQPVVEGRQAAPIAAQGSALSALDHYLIDRVDTSK